MAAAEPLGGCPALRALRTPPATSAAPEASEASNALSAEAALLAGLTNLTPAGAPAPLGAPTPPDAPTHAGALVASACVLTALDAQSDATAQATGGAPAAQAPAATASARRNDIVYHPDDNAPITVFPTSNPITRMRLADVEQVLRNATDDVSLGALADAITWPTLLQEATEAWIRQTSTRCLRSPSTVRCGWTLKPVTPPPVDPVSSAASSRSTSDNNTEY